MGTHTGEVEAEGLESKGHPWQCRDQPGMWGSQRAAEGKEVGNLCRRQCRQVSMLVFKICFVKLKNQLNSETIWVFISLVLSLVLRVSELRIRGLLVTNVCVFVFCAWQGVWRWREIWFSRIPWGTIVFLLEKLASWVPLWKGYICIMKLELQNVHVSSLIYLFSDAWMIVGKFYSVSKVHGC